MTRTTRRCAVCSQVATSVFQTLAAIISGAMIKVGRVSDVAAWRTTMAVNAVMVLPLPISQVDWKNPPANAPKVDELAFSSPQSKLMGDPAAAPRSSP